MKSRMWPLSQGSLQVRNSVLETQLAKRRSGRPRTLAGVINGVAWCTMFTCESRPTPRIGLLRESRHAQTAGFPGSPIEQAFSKLKAHLRKAAERTIPRLSRRTGAERGLEGLVSLCILNSLYLISTMPPADQPGYANRPLFTLCAASTHASTDVIRPIARCLRYGRLAPINSDAIPATKRPNAIHLGCMVNLLRPPSPSYCATTAGAGRGE